MHNRLLSNSFCVYYKPFSLQNVPHISETEKYLKILIIIQVVNSVNIYKNLRYLTWNLLWCRSIMSRFFFLCIDLKYFYDDRTTRTRWYLYTRKSFYFCMINKNTKFIHTYIFKYDNGTLLLQNDIHIYILLERLDICTSFS